VRAEALQGIADRSDVVARDAPDDRTPVAAPSPAPASDAAPTAGDGKKLSALAQLARRI
jgi:hypothetical protein